MQECLFNKNLSQEKQTTKHYPMKNLLVLIKAPETHPIKNLNFKPVDKLETPSWETKTTPFPMFYRIISVFSAIRTMPYLRFPSLTRSLSFTPHLKS